MKTVKAVDLKAGMILKNQFKVESVEWFSTMVKVISNNHDLYWQNNRTETKWFVHANDISVQSCGCGEPMNLNYGGSWNGYRCNGIECIPF